MVKGKKVHRGRFVDSVKCDLQERGLGWEVETNRLAADRTVCRGIVRSL